MKEGGSIQHYVILWWYFCSLTPHSLPTLPAVSSTLYTYGVFIHAVRGSWVISSNISSFTSVFKGKMFSAEHFHEFENNVSFPIAFLPFCFINTVFYHSYVPCCSQPALCHLLGTSIVNRTGQIKIKQIWESICKHQAGSTSKVNLS